MEKIAESVKAVPNESMSFIQHVFNFDEENKANIMNMLQYTLLSIIPVLIILKVIKYVVPEEDESKGSLEILAESVGQILLIMLSIWFINKMITYIPTYSGEKYHKFNEINFIIPFVIILATMQTKLGAKFNILIDRAVDMWHGRSSQPQQPNEQQQNGGVKVIQPFSGMPPSMPTKTMNGGYDASQLLPSNNSLTAMPTMQQQQLPDYNAMYQNNPNPLVNTVFPPQVNEPMAANECLGGGAFCNW